MERVWNILDSWKRYLVVAKSDGHGRRNVDDQPVDRRCGGCVDGGGSGGGVTVYSIFTERL